MNNSSVGRSNYPSAHIALKNNRLKAYEIGGSSKPDEDATYYLESGVEFEIELNNPTPNKVLAKFIINGKEEEYGLVLRPGERFFLDRFMDKDSKFSFDTYFIPDSVSENAEKNNGTICIKFFKEDTNRPTPWATTGYRYTPDNTTIDPYWIYNPGTFRLSNSGNITVDSSAPSITLGDSNITYTSTAKFPDSYNSHELKSSGERTLDIGSKLFIDGHEVELPDRDKKRETGRVEEGSKSDQEFNLVSDKFLSSVFFTTNIKLVPMSRKPTGSPVRKYCTECGAKIQKKFKYCANCGEKL
jgi:hypothetical protein